MTWVSLSNSITYPTANTTVKSSLRETKVPGSFGSSLYRLRRRTGLWTLLRRLELVASLRTKVTMVKFLVHRSGWSIPQDARWLGRTLKTSDYCSSFPKGHFCDSTFHVMSHEETARKQNRRHRDVLMVLRRHGPDHSGNIRPHRRTP